MAEIKILALKSPQIIINELAANFEQRRRNGALISKIAPAVWNFLPNTTVFKENRQRKPWMLCWI
ncbi:MAG: hypothetical protein ACTHMB_19345 [Candidatus Binatia bacterium]